MAAAASSVHAGARASALADVKAMIARRVAAKAGQRASPVGTKPGLAELQKTPTQRCPAAVVTLSRAATKDVPRDIVDAIAARRTAKLPAVLGVEQGRKAMPWCASARCRAATRPRATPSRCRRSTRQAWGDAEAQAYYAALKQRFNAEDAGRGRQERQRAGGELDHCARSGMRRTSL